MKFNVQSLFAQMPLRVFVLSLFTVACLFAFAPPAQAGGGELWMRNLQSLKPNVELREHPWADLPVNPPAKMLSGTQAVATGPCDFTIVIWRLLLSPATYSESMSINSTLVVDHEAKLYRRISGSRITDSN
jgi:hypothetical protein